MAPIMTAVLPTLLFLSTTALAAAIGSVNPRAPTPIESQAETAHEIETTRLWMPETWNIYPAQSNISRGPATGFEVASYDGQSQLEQVIVFRGIPPEATSCTLGWSQAGSTDRVFVINGQSALVNVTMLSGIPGGDGAITAGSVQPYDAADGRRLTPDFTFWDGIKTAAGHVAGRVDCAPEIYLKAAVADPSTESHVYLKSDHANGFWLEYAH